MKVKGIIFDDFVNYKVPCMTIEVPYCDFKCDKECGMQVCQNSALATATIYEYDDFQIIKTYLRDNVTRAICFQGLEPLDRRFFADLVEFIRRVRESGCKDDIVIYTGFKEEEVGSKIEILSHFKNIIIKFGRFIPDQESHYDKVLGVELASPNQYARRIS
jgi:hypothetical protein